MISCWDSRYITHTCVYSLVGRRGYRAPSGNILLIGVTRLEKTVENGLFAILPSQQNVPSVIFMQISATIIEKSIFL